MLSPYRVIDLTNELGLLCGQMLADLGAEVIQVEPPGGSPARRVGPWYKNEQGPERSLFWWAYARNKRSVVLDLEQEEGRQALCRLVAGADFFIESERPGRLAELGLDYASLSQLNPGLVYVSITPFGQDGPKAGWAATDLTLMAAGGPLYLSGDGELAPVRVRVPQAHAHGGADAAVGALLAHAERKRSGRGQHVDVSIQQSVTLATMFRILDEPMGQVPAKRVAGGVKVGAAFIPTLHALRDGWVTLGFSLLPSTGHFMKRLLTWAAEEGFSDPALIDEDWGTFALRLVLEELGAESYKPAERVLSAFLATKTKSELMAAAVERRLLVAPVLGLDEMIDSQQLAHREFLCPHEDSRHGETVHYPGAFARFEASPISYRHGPPRIDQHGDEIRSEPTRRPVPTARGGPARLPLEGVKILDLFWVLAGPGATRMLADYGVTVVHVESTRHLDTLRVISPYQFSHPHPEGAGGFQCANANKLGITLDLARDEGREIALELTRWADVVTESFAPGVISEYGLGWDELRRAKPDLIMISSCLMGQTGPWRDFTGFGTLAATVTGFQDLGSWPDRAPSGPFGAYTDFIAARYNAAAILAALEFRDRTGRGQYIDQSQAEAALHFLAPAFVDYTVNGNAQRAAGNEDGDLFPHGVFPASGDDRWVAIAIRDDAEWQALCALLGRQDLLGRRSDRPVVEEAIAAWTSPREAAEIEAALQARAIPAHEVLDTPGLFADPQLQHRNHFIEIEHEIYPNMTIESSRLQLSRSPALKPKRALSFGRDNRHVLEDLLGYTPEQIADLAARSVLL